MRKKIGSVLGGLLGLGLLLSATGVQAASISYYLDQSSTLPSANFGTVTIADQVGGDILVTVTINNASFPTVPGDNNFGMDKFYFNAPANVALANLQDFTPGGWSVKKEDQNVSTLGTFAFELAGGGNNRTSVLSFKITGVSGDSVYDYAFANVEGAPYFLAHVGGFNSLSTYVYNRPTPLPGTALLFGSGAAALASIRRRKQKAA